MGSSSAASSSSHHHPPSSSSSVSFFLPSVLPLCFFLVFFLIRCSSSASDLMLLDQRQTPPPPAMLVDDVDDVNQQRSVVDTMENLEPKQCTALFDCWRTEPITEDGKPLAMLWMAKDKRLDIGMGRARSRGGKCRCRDGMCTFYSATTRAFYACQEL